MRSRSLTSVSKGGDEGRPVAPVADLDALDEREVVSVHPPFALDALDLDALGADLLQRPPRVGHAEIQHLQLLRRGEALGVQEPRDDPPLSLGDRQCRRLGGEDALGEVPDALAAAARVDGHLALRPEELEHLARVAVAWLRFVPTRLRTQPCSVLA